MKATHHKIHYVELTTSNIEGAKKFYQSVFGWGFQDWGPDYAAFEDAGLDGGLTCGVAQTAHDGAPLVILYSDDLEATEKKVIEAGGTIVVPIFSFPGGRRFHFNDGAGNVLAVWSEPAAE